MSLFFLTVLNQILIFFFLMGVGFAWGKVKRLDEQTTNRLSNLLVSIVLPSLTIDALQIERTEENVKILLMTCGIAIIVYLAMIAMSTLAFRNENASRRSILRCGIIYSNVGFMGLPLTEALFGREGLLSAVVVVVLNTLLVMTHGAAVMGAPTRPKDLLRNPGVIGTAIGVVLFLTQFPLPTPVAQTVSLVSDLNTPLAMLVLGIQISQVDLRLTLTQTVLYAASAIRLFVFPFLISLVLMPLNLDSTITSTCIVLFSAPTGGVVSMLAELHQQGKSLAAELVVLSTLLSLLTLPVIVTQKTFQMAQSLIK